MLYHMTFLIPLIESGSLNENKFMVHLHSTAFTTKFYFSQILPDVMSTKSFDKKIYLQLTAILPAKLKMVEPVDIKVSFILVGKYTLWVKSYYKN